MGAFRESRSAAAAAELCTSAPQHGQALEYLGADSLPMIPGIHLVKPDDAVGAVTPRRFSGARVAQSSELPLRPIGSPFAAKAARGG